MSWSDLHQRAASSSEARLSVSPPVFLWVFETGRCFAGTDPAFEVIEADRPGCEPDAVAPLLSLPKRRVVFIEDVEEPLPWGFPSLISLVFLRNELIGDFFLLRE